MKEITLSGPGLILDFALADDRIGLLQISRRGCKPILYSDIDGDLAGPGPVGNPIAVVIRSGIHAGVYGADTFRVTSISHDERCLLAYLMHSTLPLVLAIEVEVEGNVATWRGQIGWNGDVAVDADVYYPLLSRAIFDSARSDRAIVGQVSGAVIEPTGEAQFHGNYLGGLSTPTFLVEGAGRGLAFLDDNRADFAADPGASVRRTYIIANTLTQTRVEGEAKPNPGPNEGPFVGVAHSRLFRPVAKIGLTTADMKAELMGASALPIAFLGDVADLGPIRTYAYEGDWKVGAAWLREQRSHLSFRKSPAQWYERTSFVSEDMGDDIVGRGQSFYDLNNVLDDKRRLGSDLFLLPGFHDAEILGQPRNWLNRGDYFFAAGNLGGFDRARVGVEALHRRGGRVIYYVEGLIMWKRSRIGRVKGREWALVREDGTYDEHYKGFWHMCPACEQWTDWLARTCADIVGTVGVDGFFIDSTAATHFHRCFNPDHHHPHPDVWNWGIREMLRKVRLAVDRVDPNAILFVEGAADIAREFADGFVSHSHMWTQDKFRIPFLRFLHPQLRAYESWGNEADQADNGCGSNKKHHVWNAVNGHRIYAHNSGREEMAQIAQQTRAYYDLYPEICDAPMSEHDVATVRCIASLFDSVPRVVTVGNPSCESVAATLRLPVDAGVLFNRFDGSRESVRCRGLELALLPWEFRAYELRA